MPDTQLIELAGRHYLISQLLAGGVEVAMPLRDRGIDLIAYIDREGDNSNFLACPIQLKAHREARFCLDRKYATIPYLLMVYAWNVSSDCSLYAMTYQEAFRLLEEGGHTETEAWIGSGTYTLTAKNKWKQRLAPYCMRAEAWKPKMLSICTSESSA